MRSRIDQLAEHLLREGNVDNEADARLAAVHIIAASRGGASEELPEGGDNDTQEP